MTIDNWINLTTAVGTIAAVGVALYVAGSTNKKASSEALTRAQLAAAGISARLTATQEMLSHATLHLYFLDEGRPDARLNALREIRRALGKPFYRPDDATLLALAPLNENCAHRIARAMDYVDRVKLSLEGLPSEGDPTDRTIGSQMLFGLCRSDLGAADELLKVALRECIQASHLSAPIPTPLELHGEDDDTCP